MLSVLLLQAEVEGALSDRRGTGPTCPWLPRAITNHPLSRPRSPEARRSPAGGRPTAATGGSSVTTPPLLHDDSTFESPSRISLSPPPPSSLPSLSLPAVVLGDPVAMRRGGRRSLDEAGGRRGGRVRMEAWLRFAIVGEGGRGRRACQPIGREGPALSHSGTIVGEGGGQGRLRRRGIGRRRPTAC